ncbi:unnamed protein product [Cuscuta europaea]|uniref:Uncharacterized protein n=1 Tax=Cuscuta europaea TaxID=41803 RepID=A0A9P1A064_CUSEU|nr:unnamed protein product [Cuscuta europaea]
MEPPTFGGGQGNNKKVRKMKSPKEMVSHYEAQGMGTEEASLKVIDELQKVLFGMAVTSRDQGGAAGTTSRKLDSINSRLIRLDMKLDSKPSYPQSLAIGVASGALVQLFPQLAGAAAGIWNSVRSVSKSNP